VDIECWAMVSKSSFWNEKRHVPVLFTGSVILYITALEAGEFPL
jgi:hypothetical protein